MAVNANDSYRETTEYMAISLDELVLYAVDKILQAGEESTFERLVFECFTLFPRKFGFQRFPQWPDYARVNKTWLRCRTDKGWIKGNVKLGFEMTDKGHMVLKKVQRKLSAPKTQRVSTKGRARERYESIVDHVR
ncbi:MAG: hypothetical protein ACREJQ_02005, partial [bacterium]